MSILHGPDRAGLIGDIVGSRVHADRADLHRRITDALQAANAFGDHDQPLSLTVGDEFQGSFWDLASAIQATAIIRLHLFGFADVRFGLGWGPIHVYETEDLPFAQDGPAWWAAREAIDFLKSTKRQPAIPKGWATACAVASKHLSGSGIRLTPASPNPGDLPEGFDSYVNALLICRDEIIARLTSKQARDLLRLLRGERQADIARAEGVSQSALSQRARNGGLYAILQAHRAIQGESEWSLLASG